MNDALSDEAREHFDSMSKEDLHYAASKLDDMANMLRFKVSLRSFHEYKAGKRAELIKG